MSRIACRECGAGELAAGACAECGGAVDAVDDPLIGSEVGRYRIAREIGSGGFGRVYLGVQPAIGSRVAIKILVDDFASDRSVIDRFFAEARAVNLIRHDNLVNVIDLDRLPDGRPFIVMEYVDGRTLREIARDGPVAIDVVVPTMVEVLRALDAAHRAGVVHRDLKPDNVIVTPGRRVKVLDFGIAKLAGAQGRGRTRTGAAIGTPEYMAPEQILGVEVDARTDLYAAGVMLFELATGRRPFDGTNDFELMEAHLRHPAPRARDVRADLPEALDEAIAIALAKRPDERFQTARAMARALGAARTAPIDDDDAVPADGTSGRLNEPTRPLRDPPRDDSTARAEKVTAVDRPVVAPQRRRSRRGIVLVAAIGAVAIAGATIASLRGGGGATTEGVADATGVAPEMGSTGERGALVDAAVDDATSIVVATVDVPPVVVDAAIVASTADAARSPPRRPDAQVVVATSVDARVIDPRSVDAAAVARPPAKPDAAINEELWTREVVIANRDKFEPTAWISTALDYVRVVETDLEITEIHASVRDDGTAHVYSTSYSFVSPRALAAGNRIPCAFLWIQLPHVKKPGIVRYGRSGGCRRKLVAGRPKCKFADIVPEKVVVHPESTEVEVTWHAKGWTVEQTKSFPIDSPPLSKRTVPDDCP